MIENEDFEIVESWLEDQDLNSFSSSYRIQLSDKMKYCFFQNDILIGKAEAYTVEEAMKSLDIELEKNELEIFSRTI